ncbi:MAG: type II secretion system minor pseudopilin GspK, partial [Myxococcales bacterium]
QKINLNRLNHTGPSGQAAMRQALLLFGDPRFEFIFEKPDANGVKMNAQDTLIALHDWIDERDTSATLNLQGAGDPFPDGFGDENRNYVNYPHRYRAKNANFDSLDELYQVDGVSDLFMAAFRDRVTVYPDKNRVLNINSNDPITQYVAIASIAANEYDPKLQNPMIIESILKEIAWFKMFSFTGMNAMTFINIVERNGIMIKADIKASGAQGNRWVSDKSETFTITANGSAGKVNKTITAVVRYNEGLGKLLYYREE